MVFTINNYQLEVSNKSIEGFAYDYIYRNDEAYSPNSVQSLQLFIDGKLIKSAFIGATGGGTAVHKTSLIVSDNRFVTCCCNTVFCLSIPDLALLWKTEADWATCFEIFNYHDDYIVHGEVEISRLDKNGRIVWQHGGADIFTTIEGDEDDFLITDDYILATDWDHRKYKLDFDGNIIELLNWK